MRIFTTGAFLEPVRVIILGKTRWMWVVTAFEDDSFKDGDTFNPPEVADTEEKLLIESNK